MRLILAAFVIFIGANIGINVINYVSNIQDAKLQKLCKIDPSISTSAKSIPPSQQIVQRYRNVESDGDWDDILSPDDIEEYYERRQYEKMMRP